MYSIKQTSTMIWATLFPLIAVTTFAPESSEIGLQSLISQEFAQALEEGQCSNVVVAQQPAANNLYTSGVTVCKHNDEITMKHFMTISPNQNSPVKPALTTWPFSNDDLPEERESPIAIITTQVTDMILPTLQFLNHVDDDVDCIVKNTGHTVQASIMKGSDEKPYILGGPLTGMYIFEQVHSHWGEKDSCGSEHSIDGEFFPLEGHMVYYKADYGSFEAAQDKPDGLCVVTYFAKVVNESNPLLDPLIKLLTQISDPGQQITVTAKEVLPWFSSVYCQSKVYYTYLGSLTTPPYYQSVTFIIFPEPLTLSHDQLNTFRDLHDDHGHFMNENNRRIQPRNGRPVLCVDNLKNYLMCHSS